MRISMTQNRLIAKNATSEDFRWKRLRVQASSIPRIGF